MIDERMLSITSGEIWERAYSLKNYIVEDINTNSKVCVIYFSSSSIYYPNDEATMEEKILKRDYYEWRRYPIYGAGRLIFVRDVAKQFYIYGISQNCPTIEKLILLLKKLTNGYEIITIGSSAGGYMAALAGALLNASVVFCFSGFFSLSHVNQEVWYLLKKEQGNNIYNQYYEIAQFMEKAQNTTFFYIMPGLSKDEVNNDYVQYDFGKDLSNVYTFKMKEKQHGVCMYPYVLKEYINTNAEKLKNISQNEREKLISKWKMSVYILGVKKSILCYVQYLFRKFLSFIMQ